MRVKIWGSRGSLPYVVPGDVIRRKVFLALKHNTGAAFNDDEQINEYIERLPFYIKDTYGGNTSCVQLLDCDEYMICDAGTGIRDLSMHIMKSGELFNVTGTKTFNIFLSHLHWDHVQGFPFFIPGYIEGINVNVYGCHDNISDTFQNQQNPVNFPVGLGEMNANVKFIKLNPNEEYEIGGVKVEAIKQNHPGTSYGYKFVKNDKKFVYSTDAEHTFDADTENYDFVDFYSNADTLIFDAMYSHVEAMDSKLNWGHSSNLTGVELAERANVKHLVLFHSDFKFDDFELDKFLASTRKYHKLYAPESEMKISVAYDGMEYTL